MRRNTNSAVSLASLRHLLAFTQRFFPPPSTPRQRAIHSRLCAAQGPRQYQEKGLKFHLLHLLELLTQCSGACKNIMFKHIIHWTKIMAIKLHFKMENFLDYKDAPHHQLTFIIAELWTTQERIFQYHKYFEDFRISFCSPLGLTWYLLQFFKRKSQQDNSKNMSTLTTSHSGAQAARLCNRNSWIQSLTSHWSAQAKSRFSPDPLNN